MKGVLWPNVAGGFFIFNMFGVALQALAVLLHSLEKIISVLKFGLWSPAFFEVSYQSLDRAQKIYFDVKIRGLQILIITFSAQLSEYFTFVMLIALHTVRKRRVASDKMC